MMPCGKSHTGFPVPDFRAVGLAQHSACTVRLAVIGTPAETQTKSPTFASWYTYSLAHNKTLVNIISLCWMKEQMNNPQDTSGSSCVPGSVLWTVGTRQDYKYGQHWPATLLSCHTLYEGAVLIFTLSHIYAGVSAVKSQKVPDIF